VKERVVDPAYDPLVWLGIGFAAVRCPEQSLLDRSRKLPRVVGQEAGSADIGTVRRDPILDLPLPRPGAGRANVPTCQGDREGWVIPGSWPCCWWRSSCWAVPVHRIVALLARPGTGST
jgi:hypothetical protein